VTFATEGDPFGFLPRPAPLQAACRAAMRDLLRSVPHEIQIHVHHEHYTYNTEHKDPEILEAFRAPDARARDAARFEMALQLALEATREETGLPLERWFFVHGQWALNASDPSVCHITNEIEILLRNGGLGDFTFPAGRPNVDPSLEVPYFVRPVDAARGYVMPEAAPELAFGNSRAARSKFFIWASQIRHRGASFDYYSDHVIEDLNDIDAFAARILAQCYVGGETLYFKTHAHSMHARYARDDQPAVFPHQHPGIRALLGRVFDAADAAGASVAFLTASEVYAEFVEPRPPPPGGFALTAPDNPLILGRTAPVLGDADGDVEFAAEIDAVAARLILEAEEKAAPLARGAGAYYRQRAEQGEVLVGYERRVIRVLLAEPRFDCVYEVGSGAAVLSICLALNGQRAVGIERDSARAALAQAILGRLAEAHPGLAGRCEIRRAAAPAALREIDGRNAALVFTNVTGTVSPNEVEEIIRLAGGFRMVIVDLARFFENREGAAQVALLDRFIAAGWRAPAPIASPFDSYWIFRPGGQTSGASP